MGLNVPQAMEGQVLTKIFEPTHLATQPIQYADIELITRADNEQNLYEDYEDKVTDRLRDLGYIE